MKNILVLVIVSSFLFLTACGGGGATNENTTYSTTLGQELSDLDKAKQEGVITQGEYDNAKRKLLDRN